MSAITDVKNMTPEELDQKRLDDDKKDLRRKLRAKREIEAEDNPPKPIPTPHTLRERLALKRPTVRWRIVGWMKVGNRVILAAQYKAGKTTLAANLVRSLVDNVPFLDKFDVSPVGHITVLDFEMAEDDFNPLDESYEAVDIKHRDAVTIWPLRGRASSFNILDAAVRTRWASELRSRCVTGTDILILDCLRPVLDAIGLDENHDAGQFYVAFDALLEEAGIREAIVITHMGHDNERSRGDSRNLDWPDVNWTLVRESKDPSSKRFIKAFGRGVDQPEVALDFNKDTQRLSIGAGSRQDLLAIAAIPLILTFVGNEASPPNQATIKKKMKDDEGVSDATTRKAIKLALKSGQLRALPGKTKNEVLYEVSVCSGTSGGTGSSGP